MALDDMQERIDALPALKAAADQLRDEIGFRADASVQFDPFLVVMIISIIVQVIIHCRESRDKEQIRADIRDIRTVPPRKLMRLKRRLNALWREKGSRVESTNAFMTAVLELAEKADDAAIDELLRLAEQAGAAN